jgi:hypothetical protein
VHGYDISIIPVERTSHVQRFPFDLRHEQTFGVRLLIGIFLYHVAGHNNLLQVLMRDPPPSHALLRVSRYEIAILLNGFAKSRHVKRRHCGRPYTFRSSSAEFLLPNAMQLATACSMFSFRPVSGM